MAVIGRVASVSGRVASVSDRNHDMIVELFEGFALPRSQFEPRSTKRVVITSHEFELLQRSIADTVSYLC
jgi:hypothetical protein